MIINSVIAGGGGDEVEAKALGEAVNAVSGDKVTLNFSAGLPLEGEEYLLPARSYSGTYRGPNSVAYVDSEYIYYSAPDRYDNIYAYNKKTGERTEIRYSSTRYSTYVSSFGISNLHAASYDNIYQFIGGKLFTIETNFAEGYYGNTSDGKIAILSVYSSRYAILMRDAEGFYSINRYFARTDKGFPIALLDSEDGVNYPLICSTGSTLVTYVINTKTKTMETVGSVSNSTFGSDSYYYHSSAGSASLKDITIRYARTSNFEYFKVFRTVKDENGIYNIELLNDLKNQLVGYLAINGLSDEYACCSFVGDILCLQNSYNTRKDALIKIDPDNLTISGCEIAPGADTTAISIFGNGYSSAYYGLEGSNQKYLIGFMQPIEQPYVASSPQTARFFANQTLTGIVKENDNGVLKVSTVEDPNNPPPAVPDTAGLKTVINYGSAGGDFGSVSIGYGYFLNNARSYGKAKDKYVTYDGGTIGEDDVWNSGTGSLTLHPMVYRVTDMGSWVSDTEACLYDGSTWWQGGAYKELDTPVYLWHDGSHITPAVPETIVAEVALGGGNNYVVVGSPTIVSGVASGFSADNYITANAAVGSTNNATYKVRFKVDAIGLKGPIMHHEMLFGLNIDESGNLYDWSWGSSAAINICTATAGHTYTASVNINGTTRSWTVTDETAGQTFTNSLTDSSTTVSGEVVLTYGRSSSPTATTYFNGSIYLEGCSASIGGSVVWATITAGTVSLPVSWKTLDGVVYEYPEGLPTTQASDLEVNIVEGSNSLYATRTGDSCGLAISSTSPAGVDSSAIIGTVELDANGAITSYTPRE